MTVGNELCLSKQLRVTLPKGHRWLTAKDSCSEFDGGGEPWPPVGGRCILVGTTGQLLESKPKKPAYMVAVGPQ